MPTYSDIISGNHYVVSNEGFFEITHTTRSLGRGDEVLNTLADNIMLDVGVIGEVAGCPTALTVKKSSGLYITTTSLKKLRFNTLFEVVAHEGDEKWLSPTFKNSRGSDGNNLSLEWVVPNHVHLFLTFFMKKSGNNFYPENAYLYAMYNSGDGDGFDPSNVEKTTYIVPVSNLYEDSRICFGESFRSANSVMESCKMNTDSFYATPWNSDIDSTRHGDSTKFFRYDLDSNNQLGIIGDPRDNSQSFSHSDINSINHDQLFNLL